MGQLTPERDALADALPDLVLHVRRDGVLLSHLGGRGVEWMRPAENFSGRKLDAIWPGAIADLIKQLTRRVIFAREPIEAQFGFGERRCEFHVTPQSPDSAICVVRTSSPLSAGDSAGPGEIPRSNLDRRGFLRRFKNSISLSALSGRPISIAVIQIDGGNDISRALDTRFSDQLMTAAIQRISSIEVVDPSWYMGQLADNILVVVLDTALREIIQPCLTRILESLRQPIRLAGAHFQLTPYAGVAVLGRDATSPKLLLEHARAASAEAKRLAHSHVSFFSDTMKLRALTRLDFMRELSDAIEHRAIRLRYVGRHDLLSGRLVALVGYLQWIDPMRGEIRPADFLSVAAATGLSTVLSRSILSRLHEDIERMNSWLEPGVRISFGALRHHVLDDSFLADIKELLSSGALKPDRLELRIAERSYVSRSIEVWQSLAGWGIQLVVDEFGRHVSSLELLARAPIWGLQLDRSRVTALDGEPVARKVCAAAINVALGLGITPIAPGIDTEQQRKMLVTLGCREGLGDLYGTPPSPLIESHL